MDADEGVSNGSADIDPSLGANIVTTEVTGEEAIGVEQTIGIEHVEGIEHTSDATYVTGTTIDGQQLIIVQPSEGAGITALEDGEGFEGMELPAKRFKLQQEDGKTYVVAITEDGKQLFKETVDDMKPLQDDLSKEADHIQASSAENIDPDVQFLGDPLDVSQAWFTTKDDKAALQNKGYQWKQGQWSREETDILQDNITAYCKERGKNDPTEIIFEMSKDERKDFYRSIARGLQRPLFSVYRRVIRMYDQRNHIGKYTPEELEKLQELRAKYGSDWATIGAALGRSASSVKDRCRLMKDTCNSGKWLPEEERRLAAAVYELTGAQPGESVTTGLSWAAVAEKVATRSEKQCRTKWLNYLNWKARGGQEWTREDDVTLILKISNIGATEESAIDWSDLAKNWSSARSPQWLRGKWWSLKRHVTDYQLLPFTEIVEYLRNMHTQTLRMKSPNSTVKMGGLNLQRVSLNQNMILTVPLNMTGADGEVVTDTTGVTGNGGEEDETDSATLQAYEVLQNLGPAATTQGAFLITQPHNNPAISFTTANMATDHIIVHTLPVSHLQGNDNVAVQMNQPQVIISAMQGQDGVATLEGSEVTTLQLQEAISHTDHDLHNISQTGTLPDGTTVATEISQSELIPDGATVTAITENSAGIDETGLQVAQEIGQSQLQVVQEISSQGEMIHSEQSFQTQTMAGSVVGVESSEGLVLVDTAPSPQFVQTTSVDADLIHMSSLADPMLTSESTDLIGSSSDLEADKGQPTEDGDDDHQN